MDKNLADVLHETADGLHRIGLMNEQTMREFDALILPKIKQYTPMQIKRLRKRNYLLKLRTV